MEYRNFIREGNSYKMKPRTKFALVLLTGLLAFSLFGFFNNLPAMGWTFLIIALIPVITLRVQSLVIDMDRKEIRGKVALIKPGFTIPLQDFLNFELVKTQQAFITTNTTLNIWYLKNGKEKSAMVAQGFSAKSMQHLINDIEEIIDGRKG